MKTELEILRKENQDYRANMPKFQAMANQLNDEAIKAHAEAMKWKGMYQQSQKENQMINKFNLIFIAMSFGTIGATLIFIVNHMR